MKVTSLSSGWMFQEPESGRWLAATVPGCIHTDLLRHGVIPDPFCGEREKELAWIGERDWVYRNEFHALGDGDHLELVAHGLDTLAEVRLDGKSLGKTDNMFVRHTWDLSAIDRKKTHVLEIAFRSVLPEIARRGKGLDAREMGWCDPVGGCSQIRKSQCNFGWDWGPRYLTCGIFRPIELHAWSENRFRHVHLAQEHDKDRVLLRLSPELAAKDRKAVYRLRVRLDGKVVAEASGLQAEIPSPKLWWPNGHGDQPLYEVELELLRDGRVLDRWQRRIGLRTITLDQSPDEFGTSFRFLVNGRPVFAKGANWIPNHVFPHGLKRKDYEPTLQSAADANMNMMRVWGGGIYEHEAFYDLCDELGLMVWQDFMYACSLYPGDKAFLASAKTEAIQQVQRLHHHASLALWCGNNEIEFDPESIQATPKRKKAFETLFYKILPDAVTNHDGNTCYWPGSPHNPEGYEKGCINENAGDAHFWDVWHGRKPVKTYEEHFYRFCSEFGMQAFPHPEVAATFCDPKDFNIFSPAFETHQKNGGGNSTILHYVGQLYRFPKDYDALAYLSQLNQAYCMRFGIEHFRRIMPRCMGVLYWQINDCWPVASWSSLDFGGRWKALHHESRRFFAPLLLSAHVPGAESVHTSSNTRSSTVREVHWHVVADHVEPGPAELRWTLYRTDGPVVRQGVKKITITPDTSTLVETLDFEKEMINPGARHLVLAGEILRGRAVLVRNTVLLTAPRFLNLSKKPIKVATQRLDDETISVTVSSAVYHHRVELSLPGAKAWWSDNFFDLLPGQSRTVELRRATPSLLKKLKVRSLVHTAGA